MVVTPINNNATKLRMIKMRVFANRLRKLDLIVFFVLVILTLVGVGITDVSPADAHTYWLTMTLAFAIAAVLSGWRFAEDKKQKTKLIASQLFHWSSTLAAVLIVYAFLHTGQVTSETVSLMIVLVLALSVFLDGAHVGWHFSVLGILLALTAVSISYIEEFLWVISAIAVVFALIVFFFNKRSAAAE